jgi:hypothetical protein
MADQVQTRWLRTLTDAQNAKICFELQPVIDAELGSTHVTHEREQPKARDTALHCEIPEEHKSLYKVCACILDPILLQMSVVLLFW